MQKLKTWFCNLSSVGKVSIIAVIALSDLFTASVIFIHSSTSTTDKLNFTNTTSYLNKIKEQNLLYNFLGQVDIIPHNTNKMKWRPQS